MKAVISVTVDVDILLQARQQNLNISEAAENGLIASLGARYKPDDAVVKALMLTTNEEKTIIDRVVKNEAYDAIRRMCKKLNHRAGTNITPGQLQRFVIRRMGHDAEIVASGTRSL